MRGKQNTSYPIFLLLMSLLGSSIVYLATYRSGASVISDGFSYLSVAQNLLQGRGFIDLHGSPLTQWPPLYPLLIAFFSAVTKSDIFQIGRFLNVLLFGLTIFSSGILFQLTYPDKRLFGYAGVAIITISPYLIPVFASILSDPLFLLTVILFLIISKLYIDTRKIRFIMLSGIVAGLASLDRYAGLTLVVTGTLLLIYIYRGNLAKQTMGGIFFSLSAMPVFLWGLLHNYPITGRLFGSYIAAVPAGNAYITIEKVSIWFLPATLVEALNPIVIFVLVCLFLIIVNRPQQWLQFIQKLSANSHVTNTIFTGVYLAILIFYSSYYEIRAPLYQRFHIILLPSILIVIFAAIETLAPFTRLSSSAHTWHILLPILFILWLIYPLTETVNYVREAGFQGNNFSYTSANLQESEFIRTAKSLPDNGRPLFSNYEAPAWLYVRRNVLSIPSVNKQGHWDKASLTRFLAVISPNQGGYLIWFKTITYRDTSPTLDQMQKLVNLKPIFTGDTGDIYLIELKENSNRTENLTSLISK